MEKIYSSKLVTVKTGTTLLQARNTMGENRIRHLPVVNAAGEIEGMLSLHDIADAIEFEDQPVDMFMSFPVHAVKVDRPLSSVAFLMLDKKISSVLVVEGDEAVGIITTDDLLFHLATSLQEKEKPAANSMTAMEKGLVTVGEFCRRLAEAGI